MSTTRSSAGKQDFSMDRFCQEDKNMLVFLVRLRPGPGRAEWCHDAYQQPFRDAETGVKCLPVEPLWQ
jgi:hypothetical protein